MSLTAWSTPRSPSTQTILLPQEEPTGFTIHISRAPDQRTQGNRRSKDANNDDDDSSVVDDAWDGDDVGDVGDDDDDGAAVSCSLPLSLLQ